MIYNIPCVPTGEHRGPRPTYRLTDPVTGESVTVPIGFVTDFVSAPEWVRKRLPLAKMARAAVVHDWLYCCTDVSRWKADRIFRRIMKQDGVGFFIRWGAWLYLKRLCAPRVHWSQPYLHVSILDVLPGPGDPAPVHIYEEQP